MESKFDDSLQGKTARICLLETVSRFEKSEAGEGAPLLPRIQAAKTSPRFCGAS